MPHMLAEESIKMWKKSFRLSPDYKNAIKWQVIRVVNSLYAKMNAKLVFERQRVHSSKKVTFYLKNTHLVQSRKILLCFLPKINSSEFFYFFGKKM